MRPRAGRRVAARVVALARRLRQVPGEVTALEARVAALESALAAGCAPASEVARLDLAFAETSALRTAVHAREIEYLSQVSERAVEVPFVVSAYRGERRVLEIGYAHAEHRYVQALADLEIPLLVGLDLAPGGRERTGVFSGVVGDVRECVFRDAAFDLILLVSTIEHVGRDNTAYGIDGGGGEEGPDRRAIATVARWLAPGGRLLLTVPFGRFEDHGWLVNYDAARLDALVAASGLRIATSRYYEQRGGWVPCEPSEVASRGYGTLGVPYAGAVALLELVKSR